MAFAVSQKFQEVLTRICRQGQVLWRSVLMVPKISTMALLFLLADEWSAGHIGSRVAAFLYRRNSRSYRVGVYTTLLCKVCVTQERGLHKEGIWYYERHMKNPWVVIGILVVVLLGGSIAYSQFAAQANNEGVEPVDVYVKGNPDADVTLAKYSDFSCPACAQAYPFAKDIVETYADDIRFEYKHFAFLDLGEPAAMAAEAAGQQGMFFEYHDMLFDNHREWANSGAPQRYFAQYAESLGLDMDDWNRHRNASLLRDEVRADMQEGRALGVTGTPTFFLNGERLNFNSFEEFRSQVEAVLGVEAEDAAAADTDGEPIEIELGDVESGEAEASGEMNVEFGI